MVPDWLHWISILSLIAGAVSAIIVAIDEKRDPQHMWIMNVVWPTVALFAHILALWAYFKYGKLAAHSRARPAMQRGEPMPNKAKTPFPAMVAKGAAHCGSGCTIGDILAEWIAFGIPAIAVWFGWQSIFAEKIFAVWVFDFILAFVLGVAFQYFTIKPMRDLSPTQGFIQAVKADTLSLTAWQVGMYGFMAIAHFWLFKQVLGVKLEVPTPEFWFMMQIAMLCGFVTSYPVNWWLIRKGIKEKM
ncbi:MAG: DUF4396 domain-containing protein [Rhodobacteraceae bacterium]|jgi:hypothetical protein|uniref:Putative DUF4396 protein n=1 Tax=Salipiger profundus TaxID=1229727 RepID=A0A1U7D2L0_9RHOB|nr:MULTISPECIES: DUF4396 domain-containing protein [Salipiger]APX22381.1 putative DUF4396 protein [Salipiger profundus]MAB05665.1 DUF4396 domain-containing protein [Paracoccaceae bacterium]GGA22832.1 membrane protein [Salipiger profundus]SFD65369.1 protein of unknown function [Salipiger profundus]